MVPIETVRVSAFVVPTERPESDGTLDWTQTTLVLVRIKGEGREGLGYTYADAATGAFIREHFTERLKGQNSADIAALWERMRAWVRNLGQPGVSAMAISAVDNALWDLKAKLMSRPLDALLGRARDSVPAYGSGGFTSYSIRELQEQLAGWAEQGLGWVKMKVGSQPEWDLQRVKAARKAIGDKAGLLVDANGAYTLKQAVEFASAFHAAGVEWFEEPVSSDDLEGLSFLRRRSKLEIAAGEYGYTPGYFLNMLRAGAVDVLQADITRCGGVTGFMRVAALCEAWQIPLSAHCAPSLHRHVGCAAPKLRHVEYFYDHQRVERLLFDGAAVPKDGMLRCDANRPGFGLELKEKEAARYARD